MKNKLTLKKTRFDYFLIWGHGLPFQKEILSLIRSDPELAILKIISFKPKSIARFVKEIYSFDYAPFQHLKAKTKYLLKTDPNVLIIFVLNRDVQEELVGFGAFRHIECRRIRRIKNLIREAFNPRENGQKTEDHVIHASDNENQTERLLHYLGFSSGLEVFKHKPHAFLNIPYHIPSIKTFFIRKIPIGQIDCHLWVPADKNQNSLLKIKRFSLFESPHFRFLSGEPQFYESYLKITAGIQLTDDHSPENLANLAENFEYLSPPHQNDFILLEYTPEFDRYLILDGLHRASILASQGETDIIAAILEPATDIPQRRIS